MLLWACPVSLLGLAYLLLIAAMLMAPPQRGRYAERDARGHFLAPPSRAPALILTIQRYTLGALFHIVLSRSWSLCVLRDWPLISDPRYLSADALLDQLDMDRRWCSEWRPSNVPQTLQHADSSTLCLAQAAPSTRWCCWAASGATGCR